MSAWEQPTRAGHSPISEALGRVDRTPAGKAGNVFFREMTDIATGKPIPNMVSGYNVPRWFIAQAKYHGPVGAIMYGLSQVKQALLGKKKT